MTHFKNNKPFASEALIGLCEAIQSIGTSRRFLDQDKGDQASKDVLDIPYQASVKAAHNVLDRFPDLLGLHLHEIMSSLDKSLITRMPICPAGSVRLNDRDLGRLLKVLSPNELSLAITRGLGIYKQLPLVFRYLETCSRENSERADNLAKVIIEEIGPTEKADLQEETLTIASSFFARFLCAQAHAFPSAFDGLAEECYRKLNYEGVLILYLASDRPLRAPSMATAEFAAGTELYRLMQSTHGKLQIHAYTGSLETFILLRLSDKAQDWIERLGRIAQD